MTITKELKRQWGDLPVVDADAPLRVTVTESDIKKAKRKSPGCCAFANACKRSFGSSKVLFYRSVAYVEVADEKGDRRVERFTLSAQAKRFVSDFDKGKAVPTGGFTLTVARPSERLKSLSKKARSERSAQRRKESPKPAKRRKSKASPRPMAKADALVRTGKGAVKFVKAKLKPTS